MGFTLIAGGALISFGPSVMLWNFVVAKQPTLVIVAIVSAFFWLVSIALASILWAIVPPAKDMWVLTITTGVILQGLGRLALAKIYMKTEQVIEKVQAQARARQAGERTGDPGGSLNGNQTEDQGGDERKGKVKLNGVSASIAAGVGWGAIHAVVIVGTALAKHTGTGAEFSPSCPRLPSVIVSAFNAQAFVWLDILLVGAAFVAANSGNTKLMLSSFGLHSVAALTTGLNFIRNGCIVSLLALYGVVALAAFAVYRFDVFGWSAMVARR